MPNWVQEVQVGSKHRSKIDRKMESTLECILASIFDTFEWILEGKLQGKTQPKVIQMSKAAGGFGRVLARFSEVWARSYGGARQGRAPISGPLRVVK